MNASIYNIDSYNFTQTDALFIDANIWLYIHGPQGKGDYKSQNYSNALAKILKAKCTISLDVLILSEFINRYSRLKHKLHRDLYGEPSDFKSYRRSPFFKPVATEIADAVRRILKHCKCIESGFSSINVSDLLTDYESKCPDFNDQILVELCRSRSLKFVTDDSDFKNFDITILTANRNMLNNR